MMAIGIDLAREPDRTSLALRTSTGWEFMEGSLDDFQRIEGLSFLMPMEALASLLAFEYRKPEHRAAVEAALQDLLRAHADRQGPCVTAEYASSTEAMLRAYFEGGLRGDWSRWDGSHWQHFSWRDVMLAPPLPSECLAYRMGLGPRKYDGPCGLHPNLHAVSIGRAGWTLENKQYENL